MSELRDKLTKALNDATTDEELRIAAKAAMDDAGATGSGEMSPYDLQRQAGFLFERFALPLH